MANFVTDTFTDTAGTNLESHTGEAGATWTKGAPAPTSAKITAANRVRLGGTTSGYYYASGTPATAEYDITADFYVASKQGQHGLAGRLSTSADTCYRIRMDAQFDNWLFEKMVSGTNTSLGSQSQTFSAGTTYAVKLEIRDAAKKVYVDGTEILSSADNAITDANRAGIRFGSISSPDDTKGVHFDNFSADDPPAAGGSDKVPEGVYMPRIYVPKRYRY